MNQIKDVVTSLCELRKDPSANKNVRERIDKIISHLQQDRDLGKDKALGEIEEMCSGDIEPYLRAQIWNVMSMIESL